MKRQVFTRSLSILLTKILVLSPLLTFSASSTAHADASTIAWTMALRMGKTLSVAEHAQLASVVANQGKVAAGRQLIQNDEFFNVTMRNFFRELTSPAPTFSNFTDYEALLLGAARDSNASTTATSVFPWIDVFYANILYVGDEVANGNYAMNNNNHYNNGENNQANWRQTLVREIQSDFVTFDAAITTDENVGLFTTRGAADYFFNMGTNRRQMLQLFDSYTCRKIENLKDPTGGRPDRIRKDVDRAPGGSSSTFQNDCLGCHNRMDAATGAFAFVDFDNQIEFSNNVQNKMTRNDDIYPQGYETVDASWFLTYDTSNAMIGWNFPYSEGTGMTQWGQDFAQVGQISTCMAERAWQKMCTRPHTEEEQVHIDGLAAAFNSTNDFPEMMVQALALCPGII